MIRNLKAHRKPYAFPFVKDLECDEQIAWTVQSSKKIISCGVLTIFCFLSLQHSGQIAEKENALLQTVFLAILPIERFIWMWSNTPQSVIDL